MCATRSDAQTPAARKTKVAISGESFLINGRPINEGRVYNGMKIEGLLFNSRMVQGIFDDRNAETRELWNYPDGAWDPDRNTNGFIAAMPAWRDAGLASFTINLQGGSPYGYGNPRPWWNSGFNTDGSLDPKYLARLERILDRADELGMVPIVGLFYEAQAMRFDNEAAVCRAVDEITDWLLAKGYTNVIVEIANECNLKGFAHPIILPARAHELIQRVKERSKGRLLVATSYTGGTVPSDNVLDVEDFVLLHGNGVSDPNEIRKLVERTRSNPHYHGQPIVFNEDDHYDFEKPDNNFIAAVSQHTGWGLFDFRKKQEAFDEGFQSVPCNWSPDSSERKRGFFKLLREMTGGTK
ncbi:MAG: hypothetical protein H7144_12040 [Burkholderiales bacterium]|nr:hypothetical protein [Phycisphaerae bacterium]